MLEPLRNPASWDNFRKAAVLVLIIWAAASAVLCIIYLWGGEGRSSAPANIFRALILAVPCLQSGRKRKRIGDAHERTTVCQQSRFRKQRSWSETGAAG
jgi:hypothetical protein